jgi:hypothetical protein
MTRADRLAASAARLVFQAVYLMIGELEFDVSGQIGQYFEHKFFCGRRRVGLECQWVVVVFDYQLRM